MPQLPRSSISEISWLFLAAFISVTGLVASLYVLVSLLPLNVQPSPPVVITPPFQPTPDPTADSLLDQAEKQYSNQDYIGCRSTLQQVPTESSHRHRHQHLESLCMLALTEAWLTEARQLQQQGRHGEALAIATTIHREPHYVAAQQLIHESTQQIIAEAQRLYALPDGTGYSPAIQLLKYIAPDNSRYAEAQALKTQWEQFWTTNWEHWQAAYAARETGNLSLARQSAHQISQEHPFWAARRRQLLADLQVQWNQADNRL